MQKDYGQFTKDDFLQDASFIRYVKYADSAMVNFWNRFISQEPPNISEFYAAKAELSFLLEHTKRIKYVPELPDQMWQRLQSALPEAEKRHRNIRLLRNWSIAASLILFLSACLIVFNYYWNNRMLTYSTPYAKTDTLTLPDGSSVVMNANTTVQFRAGWKGKVREVWLKGEGYFSVKHLDRDLIILPEERFIVHTGQTDVEVLGTVFNVRERRGVTAVSLISGKVRVSLPKTGREVVLLPKEMGSYTLSTDKLIKHSTDIQVATAWKNRLSILKGSNSLVDIIPELEDTYGVKIILSDTSLRNRQIEGVLPLQDREKMIFILGNVLKLNIQEKKDTWMISDIK